MTRSKPIALLVGLQLALAPVLVAQRPAVESLFPARPDGYVTDAARILDPASRQAIETLAGKLRTATGAELATVTLPTLGDYEASDVALAIGRAWKVGAQADVGDARRNAGLVLLLVPRDPAGGRRGAIRIEVGQGLEGIVTDARAGRVRDLMLPQLRQEAYGPALLTGVQALAALIAKGYGVTDSALVGALPSNPDAPARRGGGFPVVVVLLIILVALALVVAASSGGGGPRAGMRGGRRRGGYYAGPWVGGGWGGGGSFGGGGFGGFGGGGGFSGGGAGGDF